MYNVDVMRHRVTCGQFSVKASLGVKHLKWVLDPNFALIIFQTVQTVKINQTLDLYGYAWPEISS